MAFYLRKLLRVVAISSQTLRYSRHPKLSFSDMVTTPQRAQDYLMKSVKTAPSCNDLLDTIAKHVQIMNHKHLLQSLRKLLEFLKSTNSHTSKEEIIRNPTFTALCQGIKKHVRALNVDENVDALKVLFYLNVPLDSQIYQSLLQILRNNLNYLDIEQVMFLDYIFSKVKEKNHLIDAFKLALPLVFQIHLPIEIDTDNPNQLRRMLHFACKHNLPDKYINNIVTGLVLRDNNVTVQDALSIVRSLCEIDTSTNVFQSRATLMQSCFDILTANINELSYEEILKTLGILRTKIVARNMECYHELFWDAAAEYCVRNKCGFVQALLVARLLSKISHVNIPLMGYLCEIIAAEPEILVRAKTNLIFAFFNCLSNANYMPPQDQWSIIKQGIIQNELLKLNNFALPWARFALELASLGIYNEGLLKRLFSEDFLHNYLSRDLDRLDHVQLLNLKAACECFTDYKPELSDDLVQKAKDLYPIHPSYPSIDSCLKSCCEGEQFYARSVQFPNGVVVDYMICMDSNGQLITLNSKSETETKVQFADLNLPHSAKILVFFVFNKSCHSINNQRLRGMFQLLIDIMEFSGCYVIPINLSQWNAMLERERVPYIKREIEFKLG